MTPQQKKICDGFVYIKQYGAGTASLNVAVASSIVMHEFAKYHNYSERAREGEKFIVAEKPLSRRPKGVAVGVGETYKAHGRRVSPLPKKLRAFGHPDHVGGGL